MIQLSLIHIYIGYAAAVEDGNLLGAETFCGADRIHGNIAAANDSNFLTGQIRV